MHLKPKFLFAFCIFSCAHALAQKDSVRKIMVEMLVRQIKQNYVSEELANRMCDTLTTKLAQGRYDASLNRDEFAYELTSDLRRVSHDRHILVSAPWYDVMDLYYFDPRDPTIWRKRFRPFRKWKARHSNHRFNKSVQKDMFFYGEIKILPGNIGYVDVRNFESASPIKRANKGRIPVARVMHFMRNTRALIIDLRENKGGYIHQAIKFCSYFSNPGDQYVITTEWVWRPDSSGGNSLKRTKDITTGPCRKHTYGSGKPVLILSSQRTFSAAELTIYTLKRLRPTAVVVGEKTGGGANGYSGEFTGRYFSSIVPSLRIFDEKRSGYNWEAKGILPDIPVRADSAFAVAYNQVKNNASPNTQTRYLKRPPRPKVPDESYLQNYYQAYEGNYGKVRITHEDGKLFLIYDELTKVRMFPQGTTLFSVEGFDSVWFTRNAQGQITQITLRHNDEFTEKFSRRPG